MGRIRQPEVEAADGVLEVFIVDVALLDWMSAAAFTLRNRPCRSAPFTALPVDGEVKPGEAGGVGDELLALQGNFLSGILPDRLHEVR